MLGRPLENGVFGENLTLSGLDVTRAVVGERWRVGGTVLEVSSPRIPCWKLGRKMDDPAFVKRFGRALRPGAYLRVIDEGTLAAGDPVEVLERPSHEVTVALIAEARLADTSLAPRLLDAPALPEPWREWALGRAA